MEPVSTDPRVLLLLRRWQSHPAYLSPWWRGHWGGESNGRLAAARRRTGDARARADQKLCSGTRMLAITTVFTYLAAILVLVTWLAIG